MQQPQCPGSGTFVLWYSCKIEVLYSSVIVYYVLSILFFLPQDVSVLSSTPPREKKITTCDGKDSKESPLELCQTQRVKLHLVQVGQVVQPVQSPRTFQELQPSHPALFRKLLAPDLAMRFEQARMLLRLRLLVVCRPLRLGLVQPSPEKPSIIKGPAHRRSLTCETLISMR